MKRVAYFGISFILLASMIIAALPPNRVGAAINSCNVTMTPHQVDPGVNVTYQFQFTNSASETIQWIRISRPSSVFTLTSAAATGWSASLSADNATFSGGGLDPGDSLTLRVSASTPSSTNGTYSWSMFVTDDPGGANQFSCDGDKSVTVGTPLPPAISNVSASNIGKTTATITWTTNRAATSQVRYGTTTAYGSTSPLSSTLVTSHSVNLTGLSPGTAYHYQAVSTNSDGSSSSSDNTFQTAAQTSNNTGSNTGTTNNTGTTPPLKAKPTEKIPPTINITSGVEGVFKQVPIITGTAADNEAVSSVEYSVDGGQTWLPVDQIEISTTVVYGRVVQNPKSVNFTFLPLNLEDDDYEVMARATDTSGNQASTPIFKMVIDRLPPVVGGSLVAVGPQILNPSQDGVITSAVGVDQQITMSVGGGPNSIILTASVEGNDKLTKSFSLGKTKDTGLWTGVLSFQLPGTYNIEAKAIDGAGNTTIRRLNMVQVVPPATVVEHKNNKPLEGVDITLYYFVPQTSSWAVWDGEAYGQTNPQKTDSLGQFKYFLPPGKYYLQAKGGGYRTLKSRIFTLHSPMPLTTNLSMQKGWLVPVWKASEINFANRKPVENPSGIRTLTGKPAPAFTLPSTDGKQVNTANLTGKRTVLTFLSTWSPASKEQLGLLAELRKNSDLNVIPIAVLDQPERVKAILRMAGYDLPILVDRDGITLPDYLMQDIPTHVFLDRDGVIKKVMVGVLSIEEMLEHLAK